MQISNINLWAPIPKEKAHSPAEIKAQTGHTAQPWALKSCSTFGLGKGRYGSLQTGKHGEGGKRKESCGKLLYLRERAYHKQ